MADLIGKMLAKRYRVDESIGRGGMAEVYKVWDLHRSTYLAMKLLHEDLALDNVFLRRFKREAQTLARLQHPNIVRFYGMEQEGRQVFMLMDYVEGESLKHKIFDAHGPLPFDQIMAVMRPLCQALQYAHNEGLVHADVKPGNIMIDKNGRVMLSDFGIARMSESATVTMAGAGTPAYMAPEQARGEMPTPQTDIYALGVVLYEMLTGERPFTGELATISGSTGEKIRWEQLNLNPLSPRRLNPKVSEEMEALVMKCLEKDPRRRFGSVMSFLQALEKTSRETILTAPSKHTEPAPSSPSPAGRSRSTPTGRQGDGKPALKFDFRLLGISGIVLFALICGGLGINYLAHLPAMQEQPPTQQAAATSELSSATKPPTATLEIPTETSTATSVPPTPTLGVGSSMISPNDGMSLLYVPAGNFLMGSTDADTLASNDERPQHSVYLDAYWIDQTDVTNAMYSKCVSAGACNQPTNLSSNTHPSYYGNSQFDNYPVIYVSWNDATAYCKWAGRQLPSEAQWEKAARGADGRIYPWGNNAPGNSLLNYLNNVGDTTEVGKYPKGASIYGALDMAGNVWQWVNDWYQSGYYSTLGNNASNPQGPSGGNGRVLRGSLWYLSDVSVRSAYRYWFDPTDPFFNFIGFRCSRSQ